MNNQTASNSFAIFTATGRVLAMLCSFAMPIFLTRFLTKADYGLYSQFYTLLTFCGSIFAFGIQSNLYYFLPKADDSKKKSILGNTLFLLSASAVVAAILLEIPAISRTLIKDDSLFQYIHLITICVLFYIPTTILHPLFVIRKDRAISVIFPPLEILLKVVLVIVSGLIFGTLYAIFVSIVILQIVLFLATLVYAMHPVWKIDAKWISAVDFKPQLSYALPFGLSVLLATLFRQFDKLLCIAYITPEEYAIYSLAFFGIPGIQQIYDSVCEVNLLNMTKAYQDGDTEGTIRQYQNFCSKMLSFTVPLILIVFLYSKDIILFLFTEKYEPATPFFQIYIFSFIIGTIGAGTVLRASGKTRYTLRAYLYTLPIYLPLTYLGIRYYGLWGAITAAMMGIILPKLFQISFEKNILGVSLAKYMPWKDFGRILLWSLVVIIPFVIIHYLCSLNIFVCGALAVVYLLAVYYIEMRKNLFLVDYKSIKKFVKRGDSHHAQ